MNIRSPVVRSHPAVVTPLAKVSSPWEDSVLLDTVRSVALLVLAVLLVFVLLPALLGAAAPGTVAAI